MLFYRLCIYLPLNNFLSVKKSIKMAYLPRMSKTYKEPAHPIHEEPDTSMSSLNNLLPASSMLIEGTQNPQSTLKHYRYLPHPLPVLPGPSVADEANENELFIEASRIRRSQSIVNTIKFNSSKTEIEENHENRENFEEKLETEEEEGPSNVLSGTVRSKKSTRSSSRPLTRKKSSKLLGAKNKKTHGKSEIILNTCLIEPMYNDVENEIKTEKSENEALLTSTTESLKKLLADDPLKTRSVFNRSIQCTIFGSAEKLIVITPVINSLMNALAFLLYELNKEDPMNSVERKRMMTQIQLILGDLCNQKAEKDYGFDITYSDSKRVEKIQTDLQKYVKEMYGGKEEAMERDKKRVYMDFKKKEMEIAILQEKLEREKIVVEVKERDMKHPEVTLQNKRLESEQLLAGVEFSFRELQKLLTNLAEIEWDIKYNQDLLLGLKKSAISRSRTEIQRKGSSTKFEGQSKKKMDSDNKKKKT